MFYITFIAQIYLKFKYGKQKSNEFVQTIIMLLNLQNALCCNAMS